MNRIHAVCWCIAIVACFSSAQKGLPADFEQKTRLEGIIKRWQDRAVAARSFDIRWEGTHFKTGALLVVPFSRPRPEEMPPKEVEYPTTRRFIMDENRRLRFEDERMAWSPDKLAMVPEKLIKTSGNSGQLLYFPYGQLSHPVADLKSSDDKVGRDVCLRPLRLAYRAFDHKIGLFGESDLKLTEETAPDGDNQIVVLDHGKGRIWVNEAQDYLPIRCTWVEDGITTHIMEVTNTYDEKYGWRPESWTNSRLNEKGAIVIADTERITQFALNCKIPESDFQVSFPVGTWVSDNGKSHIVLADGKRREILKGEYNGRNYDALLNSASGSLLRKQTWTNSWPVETLLVFAILAAGAFVVIHHYKYRQRVCTSN